MHCALHSLCLLKQLLLPLSLGSSALDILSSCHTARQLRLCMLGIQSSLHTTAQDCEMLTRRWNMLCSSTGQAWQHMASRRSMSWYTEQYRDASLSEVQVVLEHASRQYYWPGANRLTCRVMAPSQAAPCWPLVAALPLQQLPWQQH